MAIKFTKVVGTEIRKCWEVNEQGEKVKVLGIFGTVAECFKQDIIFEDNVKGNENKWLLLTHNGDCITEYNTEEEVREVLKVAYED